MTKASTRSSDLSPAKREQILAGARSLFREQGYERTSVDAIASRAKVSKATIYNHFSSKEALFLSTFGAETDQVREKFLSLLETPTGNIEGDLRRIGEHLIRLVCSPQNVCRHRVVTGEAGRFPELGRELFECGIEVGQERLARFFDRASSLGLLEVHDSKDAAIDFSSLVLGDLSKKVQLGVVTEVTDELMDANLKRAIRTFLRAYRPA